MVATLGMSTKLGNMEYGSRYETLSSETRARRKAKKDGKLHMSKCTVRRAMNCANMPNVVG